jgi:protein-tyrosine phosphatase
MIDIHCHIIPGLDDGPQDIQDSIEMLHCAEKDGIRSIIATPHSFDGVYQVAPELIDQSIVTLKNEMKKNNLSITLFPGMEVHLCKDLNAKLIDNKAITLNHSKYILIELPAAFIPQQFKEVIFQLRLKGFYPVLAHPERNIAVNKYPDIIYDFFEWGIFIQLTASSVTGAFGSRIKNLCKTLIQNRLVHFIASDAHSIYNRPPVLSEAYKMAKYILKDETEADALFFSNPESIINNIPIDVCEPIKKRKKIFKFF